MMAKLKSQGINHTHSRENNNIGMNKYHAATVSGA